MSTPSIIATRTKNGYAGIYVHYDGLSQYMRDNLKKFDTQKKVNELIKLGDMSAVLETLEKCKLQSYYHKAFREPGYEHMQGEIAKKSNCYDAREFQSLNELHNYAKDRDCQLYIFDKNWVWEDEDGFLEAI